MDQDNLSPRPQQPPRPVMDIQGPAPQVINPQQAQPQPPQVPTPEQSALQPQSPMFASNQPGSGNYGGQHTSDPVPQPAPNAQEVGVPNYEKQHTDLNRQANKKRRGLIFVIILAVLVTVGLIGAAGYAYWQSRNSTPAETVQPTQAPVDDGKVDATDIDATTSEIDGALNSLNDSEDFGSDDLSDKTIGL